jgi:hypothetical protein
LDEGKLDGENFVVDFGRDEIGKDIVRLRALVSPSGLWSVGKRLKEKFLRLVLSEGLEKEMWKKATVLPRIGGVKKEHCLLSNKRCQGRYQEVIVHLMQTKFHWLLSAAFTSTAVLLLLLSLI